MATNAETTFFGREGGGGGYVLRNDDDVRWLGCVAASSVRARVQLRMEVGK